MPEFERAWLQYCELYNATDEQQKAALGESFGSSISSRVTRGSRPTRRIARKTPLSRRAPGRNSPKAAAATAPRQQFTSNRIEAPAVLNPVDEAAWVSTNATAQWGLAAIECLAYARVR